MPTMRLTEPVRGVSVALGGQVTVTDAIRAAGHDARAAGPPPVMVEVGHELLDLLSGMVPRRAASISVYSPMTHSHQTLTSVDCGERELVWLDRWLADRHGAHHEERERPAQSIVWDDDVVTLPLYSADDRYTGTLHLFVGPPPPSGRHRDVITDRLLRVQALIGGLIDTMRLPSQLTADVPASARGAVVLPDSSVVCLPDRLPGEHLVDGGPLPAAIISATQRGELPERFRWRDPAGGWHQIRSRAIESGYVITEDDAAMPYGLTARELEVLTLIARGYTNPQIAALLVVSGKTVAKHVEHVLDKLGCASRTAAAAAAVRGGIVELVDPGAPAVGHRRQSPPSSG